MDHPDYKAEWGDEDLAPFADALAATIKSVPQREKVRRRTLYILSEYLDDLRDVGPARAMAQTVDRLKDQGHSAETVYTATKGWRDAHGIVRKSPSATAAPAEDVEALRREVQELRTELAAMRPDVRAAAEVIADLDVRITTLEQRSHHHDEPLNLIDRAARGIKALEQSGHQHGERLDLIDRAARGVA